MFKEIIDAISSWFQPTKTKKVYSQTQDLTEDIVKSLKYNMMNHDKSISDVMWQFNISFKEAEQIRDGEHPLQSLPTKIEPKPKNHKDIHTFLNKEQVKAIEHLFGTMPAKAIMRKYEISSSTYYKIRRGQHINSSHNYIQSLVKK